MRVKDLQTGNTLSTQNEEVANLWHGNPARYKILGGVSEGKIQTSAAEGLAKSAAEKAGKPISTKK